MGAVQQQNGAKMRRAGCHQPLFRDFLGTHLPRAVTRAGQRISQSKWHLEAREEQGDSKEVHFLSVIVPPKAVTADRPCYLHERGVVPPVGGITVQGTDANVQSLDGCTCQGTPSLMDGPQMKATQ